MSQTLRKRGREPESLPDSKRFNGQDTDPFLDLQLLGETVAAAEEECDSSKDFGCEAMRSLDEEVNATCPTFFAPNFGDEPANTDICGEHERQTLVSESGIDLCYLLEASDDELGIPPNPVLNLKDDVCQSGEEILISDCFWENPHVKCVDEIKILEDDFDNNQQLELYEDVCDARQLQDYMNREFVIQEILFGGDFFAASTLETGGCI